jgi:hypothetical protein
MIRDLGHRSFPLEEPVHTPINILLQTTIEATENDWHIGRFSMLRDYLNGLLCADGQRLFNVDARDRELLGEPDPVLSTLDRSHYDELWLFAVDTGDGLQDEDRQGILRFGARGGGILLTRDHMDLGCSICGLGTLGAAHIFHTHNAAGDMPPPDDKGTPAIGWPNFHSGANGAVQRIESVAPIHAVMLDCTSDTGAIEFLPAHPHEGAVIAPALDPSARVIATGTSLATGRRFNIAVAFERTHNNGPAIAQSTFHHFADYNWDPRCGCPDFVEEAPSFELPSDARAMASVHCYVRNVALWLAGRNENT